MIETGWGWLRYNEVSSKRYALQIYNRDWWSHSKCSFPLVSYKMYTERESTSFLPCGKYIYYILYDSTSLSFSFKCQQLVFREAADANLWEIFWLPYSTWRDWNSIISCVPDLLLLLSYSFHVWTFKKKGNDTNKY